MLPFAHDHKYLQNIYDAEQKALETEEKEINSVFDVDVIPYELNLFFRTEESFLSEGKKFEDLTENELDELKKRYRFSPFRPGIYQGITGIGGPGFGGS